LQNRLLWISVGLISLAITYITFGFRHRVLSKRWWWIFKNQTNAQTLRADSDFKSQNSETEHSAFEQAALNLQSGIANDFAADLRRTMAIAWSSFKALATSLAGLAMLIGVPLMAIPVVIDQMYSLGIPLVPKAARVMAELTGPLSADLSRWMIIPGFIIYFSGELVWRERDHGVNDLTDAMPGSSWAPVIGKFIAISLMLVAFTIGLISAGIIAQVLMGYTPPGNEIALFLKIMFGIQLPEYLLFTALALFIHAMVDQKYVGHLVAIIAYAFIAAIGTMLGIEHNLLLYGASPGWSYTEVRGFGPFLGPWTWFKLYWAAWALLLTVVTVLFWVRGRENKFRVRREIARGRFSTSMKVVAGVAVLSILMTGGYIFYNTNVLNTYLNSTQIGNWQAEYERRYGKYENIDHPELARTRLNVDVYPDQQAVTVTGSYYLLNKTNGPIDSIHVSTPTGSVVTRSVTLDKANSLVLEDDEHRYRIYALQSPLKPGDSVTLNFTIESDQVGFRNKGIDPSIIAEGSYFSNEGLLPSLGFQRKRGIINPAERQKYGLAPRPVLASLYEAHNGEPASLGGGTLFEAIISTPENQLGVAPGDLRRTWKENGRRYAHYATSAPIGNEWAFFSAQYKIAEQRFVKNTTGPVTVRIFYHPKHSASVDRMMHGVFSALQYYSEQFGPYPYSHLTIVEHPAAPGTGMHADPSMISYGQGYTDWFPENEHSLDFPYAVMGHEMGHQWTLPYAYVEGLPFLSEGLAWYYGMMLVKATRTPEQSRRLLSFMRQPYPHQPIRRGEPLLRALDPYLAYKRGPLAMNALSEFVGAEQVNRALRTLNEKSDSAGAAPVSTLDLYRELKIVTPDSLQNLLREFFEVNTLWQFETRNVKATQLDGGLWTVTLDVKATKIVYDSAGVETELPLDQWIPIGVFGEHEPGYDELSSPLYLQKHRIRSGEQTITVTVRGKPVLAGIDPHHLLDWEEKEDDDNIEAIQ
jgi:ABC-2 type transport system permease protein